MTETKIKQIRRLFKEEHLAAEQIASRLGYGISTIYKYLQTENDAVTAAPKEKKPCLIDPFIPVIREWLIEDKSVYFKQRHTAKRVYERLCAENQDFPASYDSVKRCFRNIIEEIYRGGEKLNFENRRAVGVAEITCSPVKAVLGGRTVKASVMIICFPFSAVGYIQVLGALNTECLLSAMKAVFSHIGGIPSKQRFTPGTGLFYCNEHEINEPDNELFMRFLLYHNFADEYVMPYHENYKTTSAALLSYYRRKLKVTEGIHIKDLTAYNAKLLSLCDELKSRKPNHCRNKTCGELFTADRAKLLPLPEKEFEVALWARRKVNSLCELPIDRQIYVLPQGMKNRTVFLKQTADKLELFNLDYSPLFTFERVYSEDVITTSDPIQLLSILRRKPNAVLNSDFKKCLSEPLRAFFSTAVTKNKVLLLRAMHTVAVAEGLEKALLIAEAAVAGSVSDYDAIIKLAGVTA
ncbi:integrase [Clostridia bacterium]|nr:integrase [Clostridia bacterium]